MNLKDKEFRPWMGGYYMVSADGYIYVTQSGRGGVAGRFLFPIWQNGTSMVNIRVNGRAKQTATSTATLEAWGERIKSTEASVNEMRAAICAYHAEFLPLVTQAKKDAISKSLLEKNDELRNVMPCPWESGKLDTLPLGVTSWSDPIMDPLSGGFPMRTFSVPNVAREVAA
ncbi:MAG: hypothetical protein EOM03_16000 [Clostridia bacterium]|nr:hypothetical protein [Clostridia bacterium]